MHRGLPVQGQEVLVEIHWMFRNKQLQSFENGTVSAILLYVIYWFITADALMWRQQFTDVLGQVNCFKCFWTL